MKILGGYLKGKNFYMPKFTRPTQDVVRKAVFDILGQDLTGMDFIDLFSGSGAMVLEAVSRGAKRAVAVERESKCVEVIEGNLGLLGIANSGDSGPRASVIHGDAFMVLKHLHAQHKKFDILFLDPPYEEDLAKKTLNTLNTHDILAPTCWIVVQHGKREILPETFGRFFMSRQKRYGGSVLSLFEPHA